MQAPKGGAKNPAFWQGFWHHKLHVIPNPLAFVPRCARVACRGDSYGESGQQ